MKKQHILIFLIAICAQLSAFGSILENDNVVKGIAKLNGKDIPIWFNITGEGTAEVGNGKNSAISQYAEGAKAFAGFYDAGKDMAPLSFSATINGAKTTTKTVSETVYEGEGCDPVTGKPLASTGASGVEGTLVAGFIAVAAGAGTVVYTRRRKKA